MLHIVIKSKEFGKMFAIFCSYIVFTVDPRFKTKKREKTKPKHKMKIMIK